ncbi:MIT domain-containing protein 1 [Geodia barretti]|uniref:MIT domain-containing protein 1 n=1 Tax=Geodia barretti TaxID=519541 RepID=A0AA35TFL2_GEOBA|nr:MIT domain-containing protein 1 [Geodia barretti]
MVTIFIEHLGCIRVRSRHLSVAVATEKVRCVQVRPGDKGHSYSSVFGGCMDGNVESISVRDPYIRARHQLHNFVRFCELAVRNCRRLKAICLITGREPQTESLQASSLKELEESLKDYSVVLTVEYSDTLHDREIRFSNGWIVRMGRGLDYFQKSKGQFTIGCNDFDLRPCHETTIEIYHRLNMKSVNKT